MTTTYRLFTRVGFPKRGLAICSPLFISCVALAADLKFDFGSDKAQPGFIQVTPQTIYDTKRGFGFVQSRPTTTPANLAPEKPAASVFATKLAEGNYDVTIRFGDPTTATSTTIKAESRRPFAE